MVPSQTKPHVSIGYIALAATLIALAIGAYYGWSIQWRDYGTGDWLAYWSIPRSAWLGYGFFDAALLRPMQVAAGYGSGTFGGMHQHDYWPLWNPPPAELFLLPFGMLNFTWGTLAWLVVAITLYFHAAFLFNRTLDNPLPLWGVLLIGACFMPLSAALFWGQVTPVLAAFLIYAWYAQRRNKQVAAGLLLLPLLLKPHLLWVALGLIGLVALRRRQWTLLTTAIVGGVVLVGFTFILDPNWIPEWLGQGSSTEWQSFALWDVLKTAFALPSGFQYTGLIVGTLFALWRYSRIDEATPQTLGEAALWSVVATPYLWHHDVIVCLAAGLWLASRWWARGMVIPMVVQSVANVALMPWQNLTPWFLPYMVWLWVSWWWATRSAPGSQGERMVARGA